MIDLLKKTLYISLGMATMTKDKVETLGKKIVEEAKLSETEGKQFVDELLKKTDEFKASIEKMVSEKTESTLKKLNIPTGAQFSELKERVSNLEAMNDQATS